MYDPENNEFLGETVFDGETEFSGDGLSASDRRLADRATRYASDPALGSPAPFRRIELSEELCPACAGQGPRLRRFCHPCQNTGRKGGEGRNRVPVPPAVFEITDPSLL